MQAIYQFGKSTVIGGLLVLVPLVLLGYIVEKAVEVARDTIKPVLDLLPIKSVAGVSLALVVAILLLLLVCFLAGLIARMALTKRLVNGVESLILSNMPGYALMKTVGQDLIGAEREGGRKTVLVRMGASHQIGFLIETMSCGNKVVFIPNVPNTMNGSLHILTPDRVEDLGVSISKSLGVLGRLGIGMGEIVHKSPTMGAKPPG